MGASGLAVVGGAVVVTNVVVGNGAGLDDAGATDGCLSDEHASSVAVPTNSAATVLACLRGPRRVCGARRLR
jgi:hypothetical protein